MTPPSAKPDPRPIDETSADTDVETSPNKSGLGERKEGGPGTIGRKRRAASLELRVSRQRQGLGVGPKAGPGAGPKGDGSGPKGRGTGNGPNSGPGNGLPNGPRAKARAARLREAKAASDAKSESNVTQAVAGPSDAPKLSSVGVTTPVSADEPNAAVAVAAPAKPAVAPKAEAIVEANSVVKSEIATKTDAPKPGTPVAKATDAVTVPAAKPAPAKAAPPKPAPPKPAPPKVDAPKPATGPKLNDASHYVVAPTVAPAQMKTRHYGVVALFFLCVIIPTLSFSAYLWTRSADQYESRVGFGSRTEEAQSTFSFLGVLAGGGQSGSKDMDILYQFIVSQELVSRLDAQLNLRAMFGKAKDDPLFGYDSAGTIEDLVEYWQRMVIVNYDAGTGLMDLQVYAFDPRDARAIATAVLEESTKLINDLSLTAQVDTTKYSKDALTATEQKLTEARLAVLDFQIKNNLVDPSSVIANQLSVVGTLNQQLAAAQIDLDMLTGTVAENDPRIAQLNRRVEVIQNRIREEQSKVGAAADSNSPGYAKLTSDFERLKVEEEFAQKAYLASLASYDQALTDAQHKTRYLATFVAPTLAEASSVPNRPLTAALAALVGFLLWSIMTLIYYAMRDRR